MITRREFAAAAAATTAAFAQARASLADDAEAAADAVDAAADDAAADADAAASDASTDTVSADDAATELVTVDEDGNTHIINTYTDIIDTTDFEPVATYSLPLGCNVYADCESRAAVVQANSGIRPLTTVGCLDFSTGEYYQVLSQPVTGTSYSPSEARCTDRLLAWVEVDNATDAWALYAVPFSGQVVGTSSSGLVKLAEGDSEWLPAQFAVYEDVVVWQVMPDPSGSHTTEYSHAYHWRLGGTSGTEVYTSPGRFACAPNISAGVLTIAPRVNEDEGVYYALIALDLAADMAEIDRLEFPVSVKPFFATRIGDAFAFSIEANYGYGGLLGDMGYYIGPGSGPYDYVVREPSAQICYVGGKYIVKSRVAYFVIDRAAATYASISSANGCVDYGDYPATAGTSGQFVTYAAVKDSSTGIPNGVVVRIFTLL